METGPKSKSLWIPGFAIQATRGLLGEQRTRRIIMFALLGLALLMVIAGSTFLQETLDHTAHPAWFIVFWLACGWITVTALMLALFDLLILRAQAKALATTFQKGLRKETSSHSGGAKR